MENCKINLEAWPEYARRVLARETIEAIVRFKAQPGGEKRLKEMEEKYRAKHGAVGEGNG